MNKRLYGLIGVLVLLGGLFLLNRKDVRLAAQDQFKLVRISQGAGEVQSVIHLHNPNLLSSTITTIHEDFFINGKLIGTLDTRLDQGIPGMKQTSLPVAVRFALEDFPELFSDSPAAFQVSVTGTIAFSNLIGGGSIQVDLKNVSVNSGTTTQ